VAVASHFNITLADVKELRVWEFQVLVNRINEENRRQEQQAKRPGMTPVMT